MAFMFIVTIIVIAICRVRVRQTFLTRCPAANRTFDRDGNMLGNHQLNGLSFYDIDLYFNRTGFNRNDMMSLDPLLVTYNVNNGVQFVRRPVEPPPYCEIVTSPTKEGPPPPYSSHEDIVNRFSDRVYDHTKVEEIREVNSEPEATESDTLLVSNDYTVREQNTVAIDDVISSSVDETTAKEHKNDRKMESHPGRINEGETSRRSVVIISDNNKSTEISSNSSSTDIITTKNSNSSNNNNNNNRNSYVDVLSEEQEPCSSISSELKNI